MHELLELKLDSQERLAALRKQFDEDEMDQLGAIENLFRNKQKAVMENNDTTSELTTLTRNLKTGTFGKSTTNLENGEFDISAIFKIGDLIKS